MSALATFPISQPYVQGAPDYLAAGWEGVLPIGFRRGENPEPRRKANPPAGFSGDDGAWPTRGQVAQWRQAWPDLNLGLRLPSDVIGLDIDAYVSAGTLELKRGDELLARLEAELGPLPSTWRSSSRGVENPSGVRLFRVPEGTRLITVIPGGIEIIQRHHRFVCCWPSIHPDPDPETGELRTYQWYEPSGEPAERPPGNDDDIPELPWAWLEHLAAGPPAQAADYEPAAAQEAERAFWDSRVAKAYAEALQGLQKAAAGGRHDLATARAMGFCRQEQLGHAGATTALESFGQAFIEAVQADRADRGRDNGRVIAAAEWQAIVDTGRAKVQKTASTVKADEAFMAVLDSGAKGPVPDGSQPSDQGFFVSWADFWTREMIDEEWLIPDVIALGRAHVIYAGHKQGKSLYTLWSAAQVAIEREDVDVVYLDYEMTESDLRERLEDMGHGPEVDFARLHYALLPMLAPLDTPQGAQELLEIVTRVRRPGCHVYVVIDTMGRAVVGEENSNDTTRAFYRYTGSALKRAGVTWARLDHAGKDATKGQRGGSAKGDDVDVIWKLIRGDDGIKLHCDAARMSWVPPEVVLRMTEGPLAYSRAPKVAPAGTGEVIEALDDLDVPADATVDDALRALRAAGNGRRKQVVSAAQKVRKEREDASFEGLLWAENRAGTAPGTASRATTPEPRPEPEGQNHADQARNHAGTVGTDPPSPTVPGSPPIRGNRTRTVPGPTVSIDEVETSEPYKRGAEKAAEARRVLAPEDLL